VTQQGPFRPFKLDLNIDDARPASARVPEGYFLVECDGCDAPRQTATSTGLNVLFRIVSGPDANPNMGLGGRLRDFNTLESAARNADGKSTHFAFTATLAALGRTDIVEAFNRMGDANVIDSMAKLISVIAQVSDAIKGRRCVADVRDRQGQNGTFSSIEALFPIEEWETFKKAAPYSGNPGPGFGNPPVASARPNGPGAGPAAAASADLFADLDRAI